MFVVFLARPSPHLQLAGECVAAGAPQCFINKPVHLDGPYCSPLKQPARTSDSLPSTLLVVSFLPLCPRIRNRTHIPLVDMAQCSDHTHRKGMTFPGPCRISPVRKRRVVRTTVRNLKPSMYTVYFKLYNNNMARQLLSVPCFFRRENQAPSSWTCAFHCPAQPQLYLIKSTGEWKGS